MISILASVIRILALYISMEKLIINQSSNTPKVELDPDKGIKEIGEDFSKLLSLQFEMVCVK